MAGLITLLALSVVMAVASFVAGILPLSFSLSQSQLRLISTIGMGVLVGTSLIVIIPEGVETLYRSASAADLHHRAMPRTHVLNPRWSAQSVSTSPWHALPRADPFDTPGPVMPDSFDEPPKTPTTPGVVGALAEGDANSPSSAKVAETHHDDSPHAWVGIALIAGFIFMYLIDKIPQYTTPSQNKPPTHHIALNNLGRRFNLTTPLDRDNEADSFIEQTQSTESRNKGFATTIGLVIHAAADGVALGASSVTTHNDLSLIIFFAIMVHKAPAAFGLTSILLKQGLSKRTARAHLLCFSFAAPAGAISTWLLASLIGGFSSGSEEGTTFWTGLLLLFSGGTFLYVAMHAMQANSGPQDGHRSNSVSAPNGYLEGREASPPPDTKGSLQDLGAACFGMILPLFLQIGHAH